MRKTLLTLISLSLLAGCVSKKKYDDLVLQQQRVSQEKDSLVNDVLATSQMMADINTDLAAVKGLGVSPVSTGDRPLTGKAEDRAALLGKVREVIARLNSAEQAVAAGKKRIAAMSSANEAAKKALTDQLNAFQATIDNMKASAQQQEALILQQKQQIGTLASRVDTLTQQSAVLSTEKAAIKDTLNRVIDEDNTVYYAVGTKDELLKRGIVVSEGSKFLIFGPRRSSRHATSSRNSSSASIGAGTPC